MSNLHFPWGSNVCLGKICMPTSGHVLCKGQKHAEATFAGGQEARCLHCSSCSLVNHSLSMFIPNSMAQDAGGTSDFAHSTRSYREDQFTLKTSSVNLEELIPRFQPDFHTIPCHSVPHIRVRSYKGQQVASRVTRVTLYRYHHLRC